VTRLLRFLAGTESSLGDLGRQLAQHEARAEARARRRHVRLTKARRRLVGSKKRLPILVAIVAGLVLGAGVFAYFTATGSGSANAGVTSLAAPQNVVAAATGGTVDVTWDAVVAPSGGAPDGYYVERFLGSTPSPACGSSPASLVSGTTCADLSVANGTYTYKVTAVFNSWSAQSNASNSVTVVNDATAPEVESIETDDPSPTNASSVSWTVTFSEDVTGVDPSDFALAGTGASGSSITDVSGSGDEYTVEADTGADGVLGLNLVDDDSIEDIAANPLGGSGAGNGNFTGETYVVDRTAPSVASSTRDDPNPTNASTVSWTVTFTENVTGVDASDFTLTTSGLSGTPAVGTVTSIDAQTYTVTASTGTGTPSGSGTIRLDVLDDDSIADVVGNTLSSAFTTGEQYAVDKTPPTLSSVNRSGTNPSNAGPLTWTVTFSEPVSNVAAANFSLTTATIGGTAPSIASVTPVGGAPATTWNVGVSTTGAIGANNGSIRLDLSSVGSIQDPATNLLSGTLNGQAYTYDTTPPTVTSVNRSGTNPANAGPLTWTVTFSEPVSSVAAANFSLTTANIGGIAPSIASVTAVGGAPATTWNVSASTTGTTGANDGSIRLDLSTVAGIQDTATNVLGGPFNGQAYTFDTTPPAVSSIDRTGSTPTNASSVSWTVTLSESVSGVDAADFQLVQSGGVSGASITSVTGSGPYTVTASTGSGSGSLGLNLVDDDSIQDAATNRLGGTGTGNGNFTGQVYSIDKVAPTVTSMNRAGTSPTNATSVSWTVAFSESVSGVNAADFQLVQSGGVSGASITGVTGSGPYTVTASTGSGSGNLGLNLVDDDSIQDTATNPLGGTGAGSGNFSGQVYAIDKTAPTTSSINRTGSSPTNASSVQWTVTFSESVTGVAAANFSLVNGGLGGTPAITGVSGSGTTWTVTASTGSGDGTLGVNLTSAGSIQDGVGNGLGGTIPFTGQVYTVDRTGPTVTTVTLNNASGGTLGQVEEDDFLVVTFGETMDASTFCSTWTNSGSQTLNGNGQVVVTITNNAANDTLTVATTSGCTLNFGSVALSADYVAATRTFSGNGSNASSVVWNPTTKTLTITLGNPSGTRNTGVAASVPSYTASTALKDLAGNSIGAGPFAGTSSRF
jgi:hypothetical protein